MSASTFHGTGVRFDNGYESEGLADILEFAMQHQREFTLSSGSRTAGTASDLYTHTGRNCSSNRLGERSVRPFKLCRTRVGMNVASIDPIVFICPWPPSACLDEGLCAAGRC
jgi:hypothetical protein